MSIRISSWYTAVAMVVLLGPAQAQPNPAIDFAGPKRHWVDTAPPFTPAGSPKDAYTGVRRHGIDTSVPYPLAGTPEAAAQPDPRKTTPSPGYWAMTEAAWSESSTAYVFSATPMFKPVDGYRPDPEIIRQAQKELPEKYWGKFIGVSEAHSTY
ncbi:hypothetical protein V5F53_16675, partial [Xanthobacter sp. V4C-4]|uniref:hypothetical protein n=1 Tax=Xanthobacter cornucopiae TaxID=3119924 RepID=UPI003726CE59